MSASSSSDDDDNVIEIALGNNDFSLRLPSSSSSSSSDSEPEEETAWKEPQMTQGTKDTVELLLGFAKANNESHPAPASQPASAPGGTAPSPAAAPPRAKYVNPYRTRKNSSAGGVVMEAVTDPNLHGIGGAEFTNEPSSQATAESPSETPTKSPKKKGRKKKKKRNGKKTPPKPTVSPNPTLDREQDQVPLDDDEESSLEDTSQHNAKDDREAPPLTTAQLAALLEGTNANKTMNFNEEELEFLASTINTSKRTTKHQRKIDLLVARWFMTIKVHGGEIMQHLLKMEPANYCQGKKQDFAFFNLVGGPKSADKTIILNKCLTLCGMKWLCLNGKAKGTPLAPVSFTKYMGYIFHEFRKFHGLQYDFKKDFDGKGQFHGMIVQHWNKCRQIDPTFGTKNHKAKFDWEADEKIRAALKDGRLQPFQNPLHLQYIIVYILGRFYLFRGGKEMAEVNHQDTYGGIYGREHGELAGNEYEAFHLPEDKMNRLGLDNPLALTKEDKVLEIMENPYDPLCVVAVTRFYKERCHPDAVKFLPRLRRATSGTSTARKATQKRFGTSRHVQAKHTTILAMVQLPNTVAR